MFGSLGIGTNMLFFADGMFGLVLIASSETW